MGFCVDKSVRFLRQLGYNVVRHPGEGLQPLNLIGFSAGEPIRLGTLTQLMANPDAGTPPEIEAGLAAANIDGKTTSKLPLSLGLDLLGSVLGAMGGNVAAKASYEAAQTLEFSYHTVTRDRTNPIALGGFLQACEVNWENPVIHRYLFGSGRLYVVLETVKSTSFGVTAFDSNKAEMKMDVPALQAVAGAKVAVDFEGESTTKATFKGDVPLVFGFKCAELAVLQNDETDELTLAFKPVRAGEVFFNIGDPNEPPELAILTESGMVSELRADPGE